MLFGKVVYVMKGTGKDDQVELDWSARAEFVFDDESKKPRMKYYQVYLVSTHKLFFFLARLKAKKYRILLLRSLQPKRRCRRID
jgi:hypothetical protein